MPPKSPPSRSGQAGSGGSSITKRDLVNLLFKQLGFVLVVCGAVTLLVTVLTYILPPSYRAQGTVLIESAKDPSLRTDTVRGTAEMYEVISTEMEIARSRSVAESVVAQLSLAERTYKETSLRRIRNRLTDLLDRSGLVLKLDATEKAIRHLLNSINVKQLPGAPLLRISYDDEDPIVASEIARAVTEAYIEQHRRIFADSSVLFFEERVAELEKELDQVRRRLSRETDRERIDDLSLQMKAIERAYLTNREKVVQAQIAAAADRALVNVRIVDYPPVPIRPRFSRLLLILLGVIGGMILGVSLAMLREYFDHRVFAPTDLEGHIASPVLGSVRFVRGADWNWVASRDG